MMTEAMRRALMTEQTSRQNKLWLAVAWTQIRGAFIEWRWKGEPMASRLCFRFEPGAPFLPSRSFDEDVVPTLKFGKEQVR